MAYLNLGKQTQYGHAISVTEAPLELFLDNKPMTLERYPSKGSFVLDIETDKLNRRKFKQ
ncbi:hypothetical protein [Mariniflexile sp. AS56]|uniref:hypothetical protein n=1 Tax=Mariniflexile sp. AS56 TaxID=3063957 RepID=UPI0026ECA868|nr:hypothetical protein [Mariniflexile sp. AS56]MDO7172524.1 hypothetical protein [Mariniflexile sp. AS56]